MLAIHEVSMPTFNPGHHPDMHPTMPPVTEWKTAYSFSMKAAWGWGSRICLFFPGPFPWFPVPLIPAISLYSGLWRCASAGKCLTHVCRLIPSLCLEEAEYWNKEHIPSCVANPVERIAQPQARAQRPRKTQRVEKALSFLWGGTTSFGTLWDMRSRKLGAAVRWEWLKLRTQVPSHWGPGALLTTHPPTHVAMCQVQLWVGFFYFLGSS